MKYIRILGAAMIVFILLSISGSCSKTLAPFQINQSQPVQQTQPGEVLIIPQSDFLLFEDGSKISKRSIRKKIQIIPVDIINLSDSTIHLNYHNIQVLADMELVPVLNLQMARKKIDRKLEASTIPFFLGIIGGLVITSDGIQQYRLGPSHALSLASAFFMYRDYKENKFIFKEIEPYILDGKSLPPGEKTTALVAVKTLSNDLWFRYNQK